jgi:salicylate biosynthesis isochorismate synthase/menaquinone-specific isochorismate synthase
MASRAHSADPRRGIQPGGGSLRERDRDRLASHLGEALRRARRSGRPTLASITVPLGEGLDPSAIVCASRRRGEPWFAFEQPDRAHTAIAGLGCEVSLEAAGPEPLRTVAERWRTLAADALSDPAEGGAGAGLIAFGGFAFAPDGGASPPWRGFGPGSLVVPELALARGTRAGGEQTWLTLSALVASDGEVGALAARLERRLAELRLAQPLPLLDPAQVGRHLLASAMAPEHYEQAVRTATAMAREGRFEKIVLAREVLVHAPAPHDPAALLGVLRAEFPSCFSFCVGRGEATLIAASPELLVRREGQRLSTLALAGSSRRSADPAVDDHLGEQLLRDPSYREEHAIVVRRIARILRDHAVWITAAPEPELVRIANIQHLATPIRAQLARPADALELAAILHPTPAVGGEPRAAALPLIPALEGLDRGWYAGPVGWSDASGDGEFCVALRCALLRAQEARCYAGNGIVRDSDPARELAETEVKLQALLPLLAG